MKKSNKKKYNERKKEWKNKKNRDAIKKSIAKKGEEAVNEVLKYRINTSRKEDKLLKKYKKLEQKIWFLGFKELFTVSEKKSRKIRIKQTILQEKRDRIYFKLTGKEKKKIEIDDLSFSYLRPEEQQEIKKDLKKANIFMAYYKAFLKVAENFIDLKKPSTNKKRRSKRRIKKSMKAMFKTIDNWRERDDKKKEEIRRRWEEWNPDIV